MSGQRLQCDVCGWQCEGEKGMERDSVCERLPGSGASSEDGEENEDGTCDLDGYSCDRIADERKGACVNCGEPMVVIYTDTGDVARS